MNTFKKEHKEVTLKNLSSSRTPYTPPGKAILTGLEDN